VAGLRKRMGWEICYGLNASKQCTWGVETDTVSADFSLTPLRQFEADCVEKDQRIQWSG